MANTHVTLTLKGAQFSDGSTLSGSWLAEYDSSGALIAVFNPISPVFTITSASGATTTFSSLSLVSASGSNEVTGTYASNSTYSNLNVDWIGMTPTQLNASSGAATTTVKSAAGIQTLTSSGTVTNVTDTAVTSTINNAAFADGSTLSGSWTAIYDPSGNLLAVQNAQFIVSGSAGSTTFTSMGTLGYATAASGSSFEIHSLSQNNNLYNSLYVDWKSENPSSFYEGSPSLYTSVVNTSVGKSPIRLTSDGTTGTGSIPQVSGLPTSEAGNDNAVLAPFSGVTVTDSDSTTTTSATITLTSNGIATDANGTLVETLAGVTLTKSQVGTYTLASTSPATLTSELQALRFTPTPGETALGNTVTTGIHLSVNDSDGSAGASTTLTVTAVCFLRGSMIATPNGEVAVEDLRAGDLVTVLDQGGPVSKPVRWTGSGTVTTAQTAASDHVFPVRIRAGAFADNLPHRDLLVTPEHCILTGAGLVPSRMLVNGASIQVDRTIGTYDYFHVELDTHGILLSEGLATESYLDTGNRALFVDGHALVGVNDVAMAAPLAVARELVEPIWTSLADRARQLGMSITTIPGAVTDQPDLRLLLDDGTELAACWHDAQRHMFHIPRNVRPLRLLSRAAVPADIIGAFVDDRRLLGVAVDKLILWSGLQSTVVPPGASGLDGWHSDEGTHRWTNGQAELELPQADADSFLDVHLAGSGLYWAVA